MKLLNYSTRYLIEQNMRERPMERESQTTFSKAQYNILCQLIQKKPITKDFFYFLLSELYGLSDWKALNYEQMYDFIRVLTWYDYKREGA